MTRYPSIARLANQYDPTMVLCAAVVHRAVEDACMMPDPSNLNTTQAEVDDARRFVASRDFETWLVCLTPAHTTPRELARRLRCDVARRRRERDAA